MNERKNAPATLAEKIEIAWERFGHMLELARKRGRRIAVAWTGGKDSTLVLHLWKRFLERQGEDAVRLFALNLDTGFKFPEIIAFRDRMAREWGVDLVVARPDVDLENYPVARDVAACCAELKIRPLHKAILEYGIGALLTGVRADEHPSREAREWLEKRKEPLHCLVNPILEFTEMDVWAYVAENGLPYCPLYDQGYRSLGCVCCTEPASGSGRDGQGERAGRNRDKEQALARLHDLGYF